MLTKRDKEIIKFLEKFRVADRDSITELFFSNLKNPNLAANNVLLRLFRDGHIQRSNKYVPYLYFGSEVEMKKNSQKIPHFLAIVDVYRELKKLPGEKGTFLVEPKYLKKGGVEPDCYMQYRNTAFFLEIQRTLYSEKQMEEKLDRYVDLYNSGVMANPFPHILILSDTHYSIDHTQNYPFKIFQATSLTEFVNNLKPNPEPIVIKSNGLKQILVK